MRPQVRRVAAGAFTSQKQVGKGPDVIFVSVGDEDGFDLVFVFDEAERSGSTMSIPSMSSL